MSNLVVQTPSTLDEAYEMLAQTGSRPIAGGTDVIPQVRDGRFAAASLIDLSRLTSLRYIEGQGEHIAVGSLTSYTDMRRSTLLQTAAPLLVEVAGMVGGIQTQNRGTIGGNISNASPAGDTLPPLLALNADVVLVSNRGERRVPLSELLLGPGSTAIRNDEILREVRFRPLRYGVRSVFMRLGNRSGMVISVVSAAVVLKIDEDRTVEDVRIALGAVAPTAVRCREAEALLIGHTLTEDSIQVASTAAVEATSPIDDVRSTADYRLHGVEVLVRRGLETLGGLRKGVL